MKKLRRVRLCVSTAIAVAATNTLVACGSTAPVSAPRVPIGLYVLKTYDKQVLPTPAADPALLLTDGVLAVNPRGYETLPLYAIIISGRRALESNARAEPFLSDFGVWDDSSSTPHLVSRDGTASGELGQGEVHVLAEGHRYVFVFARAPDAPTIPLSLSAVQGSSPVDGAVFELTQSDGVVERLATANGQPHRGEAVAGALRVRVTPPYGYRLVAGQPNPSTYSLTPNMPLNVVVPMERSP